MKDRLYRYLVALTIGAAALVGGCSPGTPITSLPGDVNAQIEAVFTQLGNTLVPDLQTAQQVDLAKTPPDTDGAQCIGALPGSAGDTSSDHTGLGALGVAGAIQKVMAVTTGQKVGVFTQAEIAAAFQPGSAQFNWAVKTLETACIAKVHDINQAINSTAGIFTALPAILAVSAAPVGAENTVMRPTMTASASLLHITPTVRHPARSVSHKLTQEARCTPYKARWCDCGWC